MKGAPAITSIFSCLIIVSRKVPSVQSAKRGLEREGWFRIEFLVASGCSSWWSPPLFAGQPFPSCLDASKCPILSLCDSQESLRVFRNWRRHRVFQRLKNLKPRQHVHEDFGWHEIRTIEIPCVDDILRHLDSLTVEQMQDVKQKEKDMNSLREVISNAFQGWEKALENELEEMPLELWNESVFRFSFCRQLRQCEEIEQHIECSTKGKIQRVDLVALPKNREDEHVALIEFKAYSHPKNFDIVSREFKGKKGCPSDKNYKEFKNCIEKLKSPEGTNYLKCIIQVYVDPKSNGLGGNDDKSKYGWYYMEKVFIDHSTLQRVGKPFCIDLHDGQELTASLLTTLPCSCPYPDGIG